MPPRGDASRGLGKLLGDHLRERPDLVDAAPDVTSRFSGSRTDADSITWPASDFGQHSQDCWTAGPADFVMVGGDAGAEGARFARLAAKIPARRGPEAVERLLALYTAERTDGETATAFFGRAELPRIKQVWRISSRWRPRMRRLPTSSNLAKTRRSHRKCSTANACVTGRIPMKIQREGGRLQACRCQRPCRCCRTLSTNRCHRSREDHMSGARVIYIIGILLGFGSVHSTPGARAVVPSRRAGARRRARREGP